MKTCLFPVHASPQRLTVLARWVRAARGEDVETVAFCCGAALASLEAVLRRRVSGGAVAGSLVTAPLLPQ